MRGLHKMRRKNMYNNTYERPRTQIEKCEHLARMKFENPIEKAQRERGERVYPLSRLHHGIRAPLAPPRRVRLCRPLPSLLL